MTSRSYLLKNGVPVEVETDPDVTVAQIQQEVRRLYGPFHVARWGRRGRRWRASIVRDDEKPSNFGVLGVSPETSRVGRGWWVAP